MRVLRGPFDGRAGDPVADRERTASLLSAATDGTPGVRVWTPPKQVAFGRRDTRSDGFAEAKRRAAERGFRPIERDVGGRAVAYTGATLAFAFAIPLGDDPFGGGRRCESSGRRSSNGGRPSSAQWGSIEDRYESATAVVVDALSGLDADVESGEPDASFCPGDHSVRVVSGGKIAGIAQRVRADAALVAGCVVVGRDDAAALAAVTEPVYDALGVPFDPESIGSVEEAGGLSQVERVARTLEDAFVGACGDPARAVRQIDPVE